MVVFGGVGGLAMINGPYEFAGTDVVDGVTRDYWHTFDAAPNGSGGMSGSGGIIMYSSVTSWSIIWEGVVYSAAMDHLTAVSPLEVEVWSDEADTGSVISMTEDPETEGDLGGALGQLAIVVTSNASGKFEDVWVCTQYYLPHWEPLGSILRSPNGSLYRAMVDDAGVVTYILAYT
jgi:hypothetical protein